VRHWVRNLPKSEFSFSLPTAVHNFYPDFVCELMDGRHLVVEYKGEGYKTNDDSQAKRLVGEYWAKASGNLFLFAVERDELDRDVRQQIAAIAGRCGSEAHCRASVACGCAATLIAKAIACGATCRAPWWPSTATARPTPWSSPTSGDAFAVVTIMADALIEEPVA
jgi:hypothetical protein